MEAVSYRKRSATTRVILHASHTPPSQSNLEHFLAVKGRRMGLLSVGYHFLIPQDGQVIATRPHDTIGSHCRWCNEDSVGVCLGGGAGEPVPVLAGEGLRLVSEPEDNFTPAQRDGLKGLMEYLAECYGPLPLVGHTEIPKHQHHHHQCPPLNMEDLRQWRSAEKTA